jgi:hypothetical protein
MNRLILILILSITSILNGYEDHIDMGNKTIQKTITEVLSGHLVLMSDGSIWHTSYQAQPGNVVNIENYANPTIGATYPLVSGGYYGFDEVWREKRESAILIALDPISDEVPNFDTPHSEELTISNILYFSESEFLILDNKLLFLMPLRHSGNSIGEKVMVKFLNNGKTAYLIRTLDDGEKVVIPTHRSSPHTFIAS